MLRYYSDILFEYKECSVEQHVIYIGKERCRMKNEIVRDEILQPRKRAKKPKKH